MLSLQFIREHTDAVKQMVADRQMSAPIDEILAVDDRRRQIIAENEALKTRRNEVSKQIGRMKEKPAELITEMRAVGDQVKALDEQQRAVEEELDRLLLYVPNFPHASTPVGPTEDENVETDLWGTKPDFAFAPRQHWEIGEALGILDTQRATRMSGTRFVLLRGAGARLERAIANFMLDLHTENHGYTEVSPPLIVEKKAMMGTGQFPKFIEAGDAYKIEDAEQYLIPTAEVPLTNMLREEILDFGTLPRKYTAHTPSFRKEAGSAGQDTRGLIRVHQFAKVELVRFEEPEHSYDALEELLVEATEILRRLNLHYRVVLKCTGDLGFTAAKTYDPEVWMPGQQRYREISSVSNFESFQARRARIQYRPGANQRAEYLHTLNASGLAVGRTLAAILENYQQEDGSVIVPEPLRPYMGGMKRITA